MSAVSDKYEKDVAAYINKIPGLKAERPSVGTEFADVRLTHSKFAKPVWMEVKMNHTDNLSNPRVFYEKGVWKTTYKTPAAAAAVDFLNRASDTKQFLVKIANFANINVKDLKIPTTKGGLLQPGAVPLEIMRSYFNQPSVNRYIANVANINLGKVVTDHYTKGKKEPAYYMQAGDDFYRISNVDPFNLGNDIPLLSGYGEFKVRIATRSAFYEVQAEIKIAKMPESKYSLKPGTKKLNPFIK